MEVWSIFTKEIRAAQEIDPQLVRLKMEVPEGNTPSFMIHEDGILKFYNRVCVLVVDVLKKKS